MSRRASSPSTVSLGKSRRQSVLEIPDLVRSVLEKHLEDCQTYAKERVVKSFEARSELLRQEQKEREECLRKREYATPRKIRHEYREHCDDADDEPPESKIVDPALLALDDIVHKFHRRKAASGHKKPRIPRIPLPTVDTVPKYDAWIPVRTNFWAGKQLHIEPYMPFLGDQDVQCELAFEVYEDMAIDAGKEVDLSDGEIDKDGNLVLPKADQERTVYYSMSQTRWREGCRMAILAVLDKYKKLDESMWRTLGAALGIKDLRRVKAVVRVAQERRVESRATRALRKRERDMSHAVDEARANPRKEEMPSEEEWTASAAPLKQFCFTCHIFACPQHANVDVEPILPIEDLAAKRREVDLKAKTAKPCSKNCFLAITDERRKELSLYPDWSAEEILLLREAVAMFGVDPCALSIVVGSRCCCEVSLKLDDPIEADIAQYEIQKARRPQRIDVVKKKPSVKLDKKNKSKLTSKTVVEPTDSSVSIDQDFVPCHHNGPCTVENCMCVKKQMHCEATCGCNFGRYAEGGLTGGIVWEPPSAEAVERGTARECWNRHRGCGCETGHCDSIDCTCYDMNRACNPDFCNCDCAVLPGHISLAKRRCRNVPASIAKHKRTFVGKSEVHGFGLFAGETFECGDLVGVYSGQLIDTRLADMIGRLYDATDRTYIFNVTESLVIDGGMLGSKAKFCNHTKPGKGENCGSRLVRVRGDAYVALFTKRRVEPGEEFLFDYRFTGEVPPWAIDDSSSNDVESQSV